MPDCGHVILATAGEKTRRHFCSGCGSFECDECGPKKRKALIALALGGQPRLFITLTHRPRPGITPTQARDELMDGWRKFRRAEMRRRCWTRIPYIVVTEAHKSGWPHLHILARCGYIDQKRLQDFMLYHCDSPHQRIESIKKVRNSAAYITSYVGKNPVKYGTRKRYWRSQDYDLREKYEPRHKVDKDEKWKLTEEGPVSWRYRMEAELGWKVRIDSHRLMIARPP